MQPKILPFRNGDDSFLVDRVPRMDCCTGNSAGLQVLSRMSLLGKLHRSLLYALWKSKIRPANKAGLEGYRIEK